MTTLKVAATSALNAAVKVNTDLPELQAALTAIDPRLASSMTTKALITSKTPIVVAAAGLLVSLAAHYGLALDTPTAIALVTAVTLAASYIMRYVSTSYISGIVKVPGTTAPAATAPPATPPIAPVVIAP